jgi:DnaJ-class molecular chaperone
MVKDVILYNLLGVQPNASNDEIMKAYKKLAFKYHPDKNRDNLEEASKKLQEINQAKEILTNPEKRNMYDQVGMDFVNGAVPQQQHISPEDLFGMFPGGHPFSGFPGHPFANARRQQQQKENIIVNKEVSLEDIYNEVSAPVTFSQKHFCVPCNGEGTKDGNPSKCEQCDGRGVVIRIIQQGPMIQQIQSHCQNCNGSGKSNSASGSCTICNGEGFKMKEVRLNVPLKNGLSHGQQVQIPNHGHNLKDGKTDLIIVINEKQHNIFKRKGNDLFITLELKLFQAIFGFDKIIEHLDKRKLHISNSGKTEYESVKKIAGEGMHILNGSGGKGDLYIKFTIKLPVIENFEISSKLQYLLKTVDNEESNNENIIKNSNNKYIKTILLNSDIDSFNKEYSREEQHNTFHEERGQPQQCVQS